MHSGVYSGPSNTQLDIPPNVISISAFPGEQVRLLGDALPSNLSLRYYTFHIQHPVNITRLTFDRCHVALVFTIASADSPLHIDQCSFIGNAQAFLGQNNNGPMLIKSLCFHRCLFRNNHHPSKFMSARGSLQFDECLFLQHINTAISLVLCDHVWVRNSVFRENMRKLTLPLSRAPWLLNSRASTIAMCMTNATVRNCSFALNQDIFGSLGIASATVRVELCSFYRNTAFINGGAIRVLDGREVLIDRCSFLANYAPNGGALAFLAVKDGASIRRCIFLKNLAHSTGGAVYAHQSSFSVDGCRFHSNVARIEGGAIKGQAVLALAVRGSVFHGNNASRPGTFAGTGGAVEISHANAVIVRNTLFAANNAELAAALHVYDSRETIVTESVFYRNRAFQSGAFLLRSCPTVSLAAVLFQQNHGGLTASLLGRLALVNVTFEHTTGLAASIKRVAHARFTESSFLANDNTHGGASLSAYECHLALERVLFENNTSEWDSGAAGLVLSSVRLDRVKFLRNGDQGTKRGGAIFAFHSRLDGDRVLVRWNRAQTGGGLSLMGVTHARLVRCVFTDNHALTGTGGGMHLRGSYDVCLSNCTVSHNTARILGGGGIYAERSDLALFNHSWFVANDDSDHNPISTGALLARASRVRIGSHTQILSNPKCGVRLTMGASLTADATVRWVNPSREVPNARCNIDCVNCTLDVTRVGPLYRNSSWILCAPRSNSPHCDTPRPIVRAWSPHSAYRGEEITFRATGTQIYPFMPACRVVYSVPSAGHNITIRLARIRNGTVFTCPLGPQSAPISIALSNDMYSWTDPLRLDVQADLRPFFTGLGLGVTLLLVILFFLFFVTVYRRLSHLRVKTRIALGDTIKHVDFENLRVISRIGHGANGEVFRGELDGLCVAIKRLYAQLDNDAQALERFEHEVSIMKALRHPNIVLFIGATTQPPLLMVSEFMARGSLYALLHSELVLSLPLRLKMALDAARGMNYLHRLDPPLAHRDLKSPNLLVDADFTVKIADFGLTQDISKTMTIAGTLAWTAPEILRGDHFLLASDVYSFGVILWELATCAEPYADMEPMKLLNAKMTANLLPDIPPDTPPRLGALIRACWAEDPTQRPTFTEIIFALDALQSPEPFLRRPLGLTLGSGLSIQAGADTGPGPCAVGEEEDERMPLLPRA